MGCAGLAVAWALLLPFGMKTIGALFPGRSTAQPNISFASVLKQQSPPPLPKKPLAVPPGLSHKVNLPGVAQSQAPVTPQAKVIQQTISTHQKTTATLTKARASAHQGVAHLQEARAAHHHVANERLDGRLLDLICKELVIEFTGDGSKSRVANQDLPLAPPTPNLPGMTSVAPVTGRSDAAPTHVDGEVRAAQAVELIEKIETFIKDSRTPSIALTLNNSLGAKVEIERVGPREVALKVIGHKGPPRAEDIARIREEMAAHGLKVCALSVA
jgi:hypothetical protein